MSRRALGWIAFSVGGVLIYSLVLWADFVFFQNLPAQAALSLAIQQTFNALSIGSIYALIALGYTMVYGIIELINFAHGDIFMLGAFGAVVFIGGIMGQNGAVDNIPLLIFLIAGALAFTMPLIGLLNVSIERLVYRPLRNAPRLAPLITAIGVSFILQNVALILAGAGDRRAPQVFPLSWQVTLFGASISVLSIFIIVLALSLMFGLQAFVARTRLGRAMRATAQDREAASLMGVDQNQTIALTFLLGGALAAAAGVVWDLRFGYVRQDLGFNAGLKAFTAAVLGGIGNITGAVLGRLHHRLRRELRLGEQPLPLVRVRRVRRADARPDLPTIRNPRTGNRGSGMTAVAPTRAATPQRPSLRGQFNDFAGRHRSISIMVGMLIVSLLLLVLPRFPPLSLIQNVGPWYDAFANAGVYVLLAMGLNVVVGMAGLLDLGYAAFFAIGAYTYAYTNSPYSNVDLPFIPMLFLGAGVAAIFGIMLGRTDAATARRLPRDHDPGLRRDRADRLPEPGRIHRRDERHQGDLPARDGPDHDPVHGHHVPARSVHGDLAAAVPVPHARHRDDRDDPALPAPGFADRALLERDPRG